HKRRISESHEPADRSYGDCLRHKRRAAWKYAATDFGTAGKDFGHIADPTQPGRHGGKTRPRDFLNPDWRQFSAGAAVRRRSVHIHSDKSSITRPTYHSDQWPLHKTQKAIRAFVIA